MRKPAAAAGSAAFFVAAPGTFAGFFPWLITRWDLAGTSAAWRAAQTVGALMIVVGLVPVVHAFAQFAKAGGTPMPVAPTEHLVVTGFNRYIRNPMYAGLVLAIAGQALLFGSADLLVYDVVMWILTATFVRVYEEPTLARTYGAQYEAYRHNVPAWLPRLRPWTPERQAQP